MIVAVCTFCVEHFVLYKVLQNFSSPIELKVKFQGRWDWGYREGKFCGCGPLCWLSSAKAGGKHEDNNY